MTTSRIELGTAPLPSSTMRDVRDWTRIVVATLARGVIATILGMALWAAAPAVIGWHPTTVMTGSMEPRLTPGDVVVSRPVAETSLHVGQVILYDDPDMPGELRLHRFHAAGADGQIITKGDANPQADSTPIARSAVHGVAFIRVPYVGTPVMWLRDGAWQKTVALVVALAGLALLATIDASLRRSPDGDGDRDGDGDVASGRADATDIGLEARGGAATGLPSVSAPVPTTAAVRRRDVRRRARRVRRLRRAGAALAIVVVAGGMGFMVPAKALAAPFGATTVSPVSHFTGTSAVAATGLTCTNNADGTTVTIAWAYAGETVQGFDVMNGTTVVSSAAGTARSAKVSGSGALNLGSTTPMTVRTDLTTTWTATSSTSVNVRTTGFLGSYTARCA